MSAEFFTLHRDLPREGPGEPLDVEWAVRTAGLENPALVLDAACGPGSDTVTLAQAMPSARIESVDQIEHFVDAARKKTAFLGERTHVFVGDMFDQTGPYDLIWCAGAAYFQGVSTSLKRWRKVLNPTGRIAFSEAVWLRNDPPPTLRNCWEEYSDMTDIAGTIARIKGAGFHVLDMRILSEKAWENYYEPMQARIDYLRKTHVGPELVEVLEDGEFEIAMRRQYPEHYGYALFVVGL